MNNGKLTAKRVEALKATGRYGDGHGLYLQITPTGVKSWLLRYQYGERERWMGLGPFHTVSLKEARERARGYRQQLINDLDPLEEKRKVKAARLLAAAKTVTFEDAAAKYVASHRAGWKNTKHAAQWESTLETYCYPHIGKLSVADIDTDLVLKCLEPIWTAKPETASRVRGRIESVLDWAKVRGYRQGENPARWRGHLDKLLPSRRDVQEVEHHTALPYGELAPFIAALRGREALAARALEFTILTAARTGEIIGAKWGEIDLDNKLWVVPASRMKAKKEHRVPLSNRAVEILKALPREQGNPFVFIGPRGRGLSSMAMLNLLQRMGRAGELTIHGFRSTFRDWVAERTSYPSEMAEMALAHAVSDKVEAAYRRGDMFEKRRRFMEAWAKFCDQPVVEGNNVLQLRGQP